MKKKYKFGKTDGITRLQMIVTGFAFILFLLGIIVFISSNPLNQHSYIYTFSIIICGLLWVYAFYRNYNRDKYF